MKTFYICVLLLATMISCAQENEVRMTVDRFFEAMHNSDTIALKKVCSSDIVLHSVSQSPKGERFSVENSKEFFKSIATVPANVKIFEKLLSYDIKIDGPMAHAWTPYEFYINGKLSHSGVNSFQLVKLDGSWKITYIIDTRKRAPQPK